MRKRRVWVAQAVKGLEISWLATRYKGRKAL